jgi:hypothetical protein
LLALAAALQCGAAEMTVAGQHIRVEFDRHLHSRVVATFAGKTIPLGRFAASESIRIAGKNVTDFAFESVKHKAIHDAPGAGVRFVLTGSAVGFCPCGTATSFFMLPYLNMSVASDPRSSWQVRTKGKTLKALHGESIA